MKRILILCTGNSCRSKMAQAVLQHLDNNLIVCSAGTQPAKEVNPLAVRVMDEVNMPIVDLTTHDVKEYESKSWNYVITVCDHARETCPVFSGKVGQRLHIGFSDPAMAKGSEEEKLSVFRKVRNEIINSFNTFYQQISKKDF